MPIVSVPRNGPPEAMSCPVMLCDGCGDRIHQGGTEFEAPDRARRPGMAVTWSRYVGHDTDGPAHTRLESSPMFFIHKGQCDRAFRAYGEQFYPLEDGWTQLWDDIEGVMQQLAHNMTHPFEDDPELADGTVLYYPPARIVDLRPGAFAITPDWLVGTVRNREAEPEA